MEALIGIVDEQLLKTVVLQYLKPINIQESKAVELLVSGIVGDRVDFIDNPLKKSLVEYLGEGVDELLHLSAVEVFGEDLAPNLYLIASQRTHQHFLFYLQ
jgi:hypothetical protein